MPALDQLAASVGSWRGTNRLHNPHTNAPEDSPSTLTVAPMLNGRFLRVDYTWACEGDPQTGSLLLGADPESGVTGHWIDTWHMGHKVMSCQGAVEGGQITLRGSYACPPGPDWGWRIELAVNPQRPMCMLMFNVSPEGRSQPAAEATYTRESPAASPLAGAESEPRLSTIGQIAVTVSDVPSALRFYR